MKKVVAKKMVKKAVKSVKKRPVWNDKPKNFRKTVELTGGPATVYVSFRPGVVQAKVKARFLGQSIRRPNGEIITTPLKVKITNVKVVLDSGVIVQAHSCCKPPDSFTVNEGIRYALRHLFVRDNDGILDKESRARLMEMCVRKVRRTVSA